MFIIRIILTTTTLIIMNTTTTTPSPLKLLMHQVNVEVRPHCCWVVSKAVKSSAKGKMVSLYLSRLEQLKCCLLFIKDILLIFFAWCVYVVHIISYWGRGKNIFGLLLIKACPPSL